MCVYVYIYMCGRVSRPVPPPRPWYGLLLAAQAEPVIEGSSSQRRQPSLARQSREPRAACCVYNRLRYACPELRFICTGCIFVTQGRIFRNGNVFGLHKGVFLMHFRAIGMCFCAKANVIAARDCIRIAQGCILIAQGRAVEYARREEKICREYCVYHIR